MFQFLMITVQRVLQWMKHEQQLQQYNPKSIGEITIGEIRKPKQSVRF